MPKASKTQRWIDLLTALLDHRYPISFDEIARQVPGYTGKAKETVKRMFERDKAELRALGVPIESEPVEDVPGESAYRLRTKDFYLPYLSVATPRGRTTPSRVDRYGYMALTGLTFEADELRAVAEGAQRARQLGNPPLTADVDAAVRKLAFDLPVDAVTVPGDVHIAQPRARANGKILEILGAALHARRTVRIVYHTLEAATTTSRVVEPYGLFFLNAHWYLVARDVEKEAVRNFRVSRIAEARPTSQDKELPDYEIPADFRLREHARSRQAWELGDNDAVAARVRFVGSSGAVTPAASLGMPVPGRPDARCFKVRRMDAFVRWLLSFAGEAMPEAPDRLVREFERQVAETRALYTAGGDR